MRRGDQVQNKCKAFKYLSFTADETVGEYGLLQQYGRARCSSVLKRSFHRKTKSTEHERDRVAREI